MHGHTAEYEQTCDVRRAVPRATCDVRRAARATRARARPRRTWRARATCRRPCRSIWLRSSAISPRSRRSACGERGRGRTRRRLPRRRPGAAGARARVHAALDVDRLGQPVRWGRARLSRRPCRAVAVGGRVGRHRAGLLPRAARAPPRAVHSPRYPRNALRPTGARPRHDHHRPRLYRDRRVPVPRRRAAAESGRRRRSRHRRVHHRCLLHRLHRPRRHDARWRISMSSTA